MDYPETLKYSQSHEWARQDGDKVVVGITDYAQEQLGDVVFVELPSLGKTVSAGEAIAVVESVKTASDIYAPVSGEIVETNAALADKPELLNQSPFGEGWMFKIRPSQTGELDGLMSAAAYRQWVESQ
ncbi:glycine cleavage system protein GcvH [Meiothermus granaticius]|uniref:Glycine cleavage system H protein n=1 Tax=Meiothermus granaticius NBRC 107808 TaxID=1227551 RepID=A0A399F6Y6_9DEIN|nr:glycine cleavage system protein GcvH [Meiothermus granaticius]RIH92447.1 Glycine cleavage system H protein [Meiothermus granaticius NBRC 107808]GEM87145.1 glycine cleavage system H protein [Meiothermus granaticius NBRC 107808]